MRHPTNHIFQHTPESLRQWCAECGWPGYRADQILEWVYRRHEIDPNLMTNLRADERERLANEMTFLSGDTLGGQAATDGTQKLLIQWWKGDAPDHTSATPPGGDVRALPLPLAGIPPQSDPSRQTECVMIPTEDRRTACISSQVGCPVGCRFCASGLGGLDGNLSAGRIIEQVWRLSHLPGVGRITNVVFMGMGEPLANFSPVMHAVRALAAPWGMGISARRITISTVGLPAAIERLAEQLDLPVTLALSLHAPNDTLRRELIPWAQYSTIEQLLGSCDKWFKKTGREITLEYILLGGVNDRPEHAQQLADLARTLRANINLIRYNEVGGLPYARPKTEDVRRFQDVLRQHRINSHIRASRGRDIAAACGQLRHEHSGVIG